MPAKKATTKRATKRARNAGAVGAQSHKFRHKLLLNQWLISLFGIDPFREPNVPGIAKPLPFHALSSPIRDPRMEGLDQDESASGNMGGGNRFPVTVQRWSQI